MCGIVGIYLKNKKYNKQLGKLLTGMMNNMASRGPDSAGFAIYNKSSKFKYTVCLQNNFELKDLKKLLKNKIANAKYKVISDHVVIESSSKPEKTIPFLKSIKQIDLVGYGKSIEIFKQVGNPKDVVKKFSLDKFSGSHAIGHTRMATESAVTTLGAHPFNTGSDLCLVHNGSLSNHNDLRKWLFKEKGIVFQTENDSEVAAGYISYKMEEGLSLKEALENALDDLDGFYTFAVGTKNGFAILRDRIACKPAVIAETDDWVGMASEFRALSRLPNISNANVWEPSPGKVYSWGA